MNWNWHVRSRDGGMNGLEFSTATTAGGLRRVLIHAAPEHAQIEIRAEDDELVARAELDRRGDYTPMTEVALDDAGELHRDDIWPDETALGLPVLIAGGEVGLLQQWEHAADRTWWRWTVEFSNHTGRPPDWAPGRQR